MTRTVTTGRLSTLVAVIGAILLGTMGPAQAATLVASWSMNDTGGTMADATGRGHTGTLHNVAVGQPGRSGAAYGFTRKPAYVTVPSSPDFSPGAGNFRFTLSVRFGAPPSAAVVDFDVLRRGLSTTAGGDYKAEILGSGRAFCLYRGSAGAVSLSAGPSLADNRWHTITCARVGESVVLTVDGTQWTKAGKIGSITNSASVFIGAKSSAGDDQYTGLMDEVSITKG
jgi:hypothetical protein